MDTAKKIDLFALAGSHSINSFYMHLLIPILPLIVLEFGTPALVSWLAVYLASWKAAAQMFVIPGVIRAGLIWLRFHDSNVKRRPIREAARMTFRALLLGSLIAYLLYRESERRPAAFAGEPV